MPAPTPEERLIKVDAILLVTTAALDDDRVGWDVVLKAVRDLLVDAQDELRAALREERGDPEGKGRPISHKRSS